MAKEDGQDVATEADIAAVFNNLLNKLDEDPSLLERMRASDDDSVRAAGRAYERLLKRRQDAQLAEEYAPNSQQELEEALSARIKYQNERLARLLSSGEFHAPFTDDAATMQGYEALFVYMQNHWGGIRRAIEGPNSETPVDS